MVAASGRAKAPAAVKAGMTLLAPTYSSPQSLFSKGCHHPLLLLPSVFPSIRVFSNQSALCIRWPKYWSFSFSISPSSEYSGLISVRIDWFDLAVQGTLKSPAQFENISSLGLSFMVQLTSVHEYWKNHSFDYMDLCQQSDVSLCFSISCPGLS